MKPIKKRSEFSGLFFVLTLNSPIESSNASDCSIVEPAPYDPSSDPGSTTSTTLSASAAAVARLSLMDAYEGRRVRLNNALLAMNSPYAELERSLLQMQYGEVTQGLATYDAIAQTMPLTAQEANEFAIGGTIIRLVAHHYLSNASTWDSLSNTELDSLRYVREHTKMWAHERACTWLSIAADEHCPTILPDVPDEPGNTMRKMLESADMGSAAFLNIKPNPSNRYFELSYQLDNEQDAQLMISDVTGRSVQTINLPARQNKYTINATEWTSGVYLYRMVQGGKTLYNEKLIKQ